MDFQRFNYQSVATSEEKAAVAFPALMRKVYVWMSMALVITGLTAWIVAHNASLLNLIYGNSAVIWILFIAEIGLVIGLSAAIHKLSLPVATLMFVIYSVLNGAVFSSIFLVYTMSSIATVFFITAGTFAAMSVFGYVTKKDLTSMGKFLMMAVIGLIIATVVNLFMKSSGMSMIISYAGVLIFVGLTAYDTQKIKNMCLQAPDTGETMQKLALLGALSLYLDFINLFIYLLRILGNRE
ncbi:MAG: Bax inhibitor-1/YccA family protein [Prevotella sp.]|nr:Bax inhibitor-1/YccA family protein [Prevotella sp.]